MNDNVNPIISRLEQAFQRKEAIIAEKDATIAEKESAISERDAIIADKDRIIRDKDGTIHNQQVVMHDRQVVIDNQQLAIDNLNLQLITHQHAFWWRITKPMRVLTRGVKCVLKAIPGLKRAYYWLRGWEYGKYIPIIDTIRHEPHKHWQLSNEEREHQINKRFTKDIKFSILVPLYNTPENFFKELIDSVICQTYSNWELCLADGSEPGHKYIREIIKNLPKKYRKRIKYKKLKENLGISENTNECINLATGDYLALLDHDDALHPSALFENMKVICDIDADFLYSDECQFTDYLKDAYNTFYKPDFAPDTLRGCNYICHFSVFSKTLQEKVGVFRGEFNGSQDYDMILRLTENANNIAHIPKLLYFWRVHQNSAAAGTDAKPYAYTAAINALNEHIKRVGLNGTAVQINETGFYKINYQLNNNPLISIIIPNKDGIDILEKCLTGIFEKTTYDNYEVVIVENNSKNKKTFKYYDGISKNPRVKIDKYDGIFNYSKVNNYAVSKAAGEYIVLLNNDTEIITNNWLEEMLMFAQRDDVGAVGAMLYYPDDTIQHAGVVLGIGGVAGHTHYMDGSKRGDYGYFGRLIIAQNLTCITAACIMLPKKVFDEVDGLNNDFAFAFNDIDLCMRIRKAGYLIVWTPFAELYHHESKTRGYEDTPEKQKRFENEVYLFQDLWAKELEAGDPYYNVNLTLDKSDFSEKE